MGVPVMIYPLPRQQFTCIGILNYGISFGISSSGLLILDLELMSFSSFIQRSGFSIACLIELGDVCFLPEYVCLSFPY